MRRHATTAMAEARGYASKLCTAPTPAVLILGKPTLCYHLLRRRACHRWLLRSERAPRASSFKLLVQLARHHGRPVQQSMVLEHHEYHKSTGCLLHRDNLRVQADLVSHPPVGQHAPRWAAARAAPPARDLAERCPRTLWTPLAPYSTGCASFCAWVGLGLGRPTGVLTLGST